MHVHIVYLLATSAHLINHVKWRHFVNRLVCQKEKGCCAGINTRLSSRLKELESQSGDPSAPMLARQILNSLENLDSDFKTHYLALIDAFEDEETLEREQQVLGEHDDLLAALLVQVN